MANNYKKGDHDTRPWGTWEVLDAGDTFCVKKITVTPGNILSLQSHNHRAELRSRCPRRRVGSAPRR